jgi:hypothetical protein
LSSCTWNFEHIPCALSTLRYCIKKKTPKIYCLIIANIWSLISLWAS